MRPLRERNAVLIAIAGLAVLALIAVVVLDSGNLPIIGGGTTYTADFTEAAGLTPGNEVRVAGVTVGKVTGVALDGDQVKVTFKVKNTWVGDASTVAIDIRTLLGEKYLALDPQGTVGQNPSLTIPASRTTSPYDVTQAFQQLGRTAGQLNTGQIANSLEAISAAFANTPPDVRKALTGLSALSQTISSRDTQLAQLLAGTNQLTGQLADENSRFQTLLSDGNLLLSELQQQQQAIGSLLSGTQALAVQLSGLVTDDSAAIGPMLAKLNQVTTVLQANQANLNRALALAGPYYRLVGNALGNGRWFDAYLCGLVPRSYQKPGTYPVSGCIPPKTGGGG
jgi:phospholipid/cholesterol/gamma-HCH transport system substrate-binding protein